MKKISLGFLLSFGGLLNALPLGNPTDASLYFQGVFFQSNEPCFHLRLGFYGDYDYNRYMAVLGGGEITTTERFTNSALLVLNIFDRLDCFTTLGSTTISFFGDPHAFPVVTTISDEIRLFFKPAFSWSVGARATLLEWSAIGIGIEGEYFRSRPSFDRLLDMTSAVTFPIEHAAATFSEWQVGLGASYTFSTACASVGIIPYVGLTFSRARLALDDLFIDELPIEIRFANLHTRKPWAYAIGTTFLLRESVGITVEGRFAGDKALHVNGQLRF